MANTYLRQTPLAHLHLDARAANEAANATTGVHIGERLLLGMINLRGQRSNPDFGQASLLSLVDVPIAAYIHSHNDRSLAEIAFAVQKRLGNFMQKCSVESHAANGNDSGKVTQRLSSSVRPSKCAASSSSASSSSSSSQNSITDEPW